MVNLDRLAQEIRNINPRKRLFRVLKAELSVLGYWKNRARGNPSKGFKSGFGKNNSKNSSFSI